MNRKLRLLFRDIQPGDICTGTVHQLGSSVATNLWDRQIIGMSRDGLDWVYRGTNDLERKRADDRYAARLKAPAEPVAMHIEWRDAA